MSNNHPKANITHLKIIDHDSKQVAREARKDIQSELLILPSTATQEKCISQKSSTTFLEKIDLPMGPTKW